jgi:tetratricopeptide (TPR) repeat protein
MASEHIRALEYGNRALVNAEPGHIAVQAQARHALNQVYNSLGDYPRSAEYAQSIAPLFDGGRLLERYGQPFFPAANYRCWIAWSLAELGQFAEGAAAGQEGLRIAEIVDHPFTLVTTLVGLSVQHIYRGEFLQAIPLLERGRDLCITRSVRDLLPTTSMFLGYAFRLAGRSTEAMQLLEDALQTTTEMRLRYIRVMLWVRLGEAYLDMARSAEAADLADEAV